MKCVLNVIVSLWLIGISGVAAAEQTQASLPDAYYEVNGFVEVFAFDASEIGDARFKTQAWVPKEPLAFEIVGKVSRSATAGAATPSSDVSYIIRFFDIVGENDADKGLVNTNVTTRAFLVANPAAHRVLFVTSKENDQLFWISKGVLDEYVTDGFVVKRAHTWHHALGPTWGLSVALPFKLRPAAGGQYTKLETDVTLGGYFGARTRVSSTREMYLSFVVTGGLVTLPVNSDNTGRSDGGMTEGDTEDTTLLGVTISGGFVFDLEGFQIGVMGGVDRATGEAGRTWIYNKEPWFSFSIGYTFLKKE
jgi:hypothetical protein